VLLASIFFIFFAKFSFFHRRIDEKMVKYMYFMYKFFCFFPIFLSSFIFPGDFLLKCLDLKLKNQRKPKIIFFIYHVPGYMDLKKNPNSIWHMRKYIFLIFLIFSIEKIMEASKKLRQCNHFSIIHKISIEKIVEVKYYTNYPKIAVWYLLKIS
jgi:hypothetical protein